MTEALLKVRKKGVTILPKQLREAAGIVEGSKVRARVLPMGILLRPLASDPVGALEGLPTIREESSVKSIRRLRRSIDRQLSS